MSFQHIMHHLYNFSSSTSILISIVVVLVASLLLSSQLSFRYLFSPGPWGIPILGYYPFLRKEDYHVHLAELAKRYGDVYVLSMLRRRFLHLGSHKSIREALVTKADCFTGRPKDFSLFHCIFQDGIFYIDGENWKTIRKYLVQGMKELGIGPKEQIKNPLSSSIQKTLTYLKEHEGQPINILDFLSTQCTEVVRRMIVGDNISFETAQELQNAYLDCSPVPTVANLFSGTLAKHLVLKWVPGYKKMFAARKKFIKILEAIIDEHKIAFDFENPRDLIDIYLRDKKIKEEKGDSTAKYFTDVALTSTILQAYGDGGSSIGFLISLNLSVLAENESVQDELYEEIKSEIGLNRLPTYEDRKRLPLMNSVIKELERKFASMVAITGLESNCDTTISGVFVPKGTVIIENFHATHNDPAVYKNPENFNPRRFLKSENNKTSREELPTAFSIGKRACAGESLVSTEVFVFLSAILQNFKVLPTTKDQKRKANIEASGPLNYVVIAISR